MVVMNELVRHIYQRPLQGLVEMLVNGCKANFNYIFLAE